MKVHWPFYTNTLARSSIYFLKDFRNIKYSDFLINLTIYQKLSLYSANYIDKT